MGKWMDDHEKLEHWLQGSAAYEDGDYQTALEFLIPIAGDEDDEYEEDGLVIAQLAIAEIYMEGLGVQADSCKAMRWYKKALKGEDASAEFMVGDAYLNGSDGLEKNLASAHSLITKSACRNYQPAQFSLSCIWRDGMIGAPHDIVHAYVWMKMASRPGDGIMGSSENLCGMQLTNWLPRELIDYSLCLDELQKLASTMTNEQIDKGEMWVRRWEVELLLVDT